MRKPIVALTLVILLVVAQLIASAPMRKSLRTTLNSDYVRAMAAYRKLESRLPRDELRAITAIGILNGVREAEHEMEKNLVEVIKDLLLNTDMTDDDELMPKIERIENQLTRDHRALMILTSALDLVTGVKDVRDFKTDMQQVLQQVRRQSNAEHEEHEEEDKNDTIEVTKEDKNDVGKRVAALRQHILKQVKDMKALVEQKIEHTLDYLIDEADEDGLLAKASQKVVRKRAVEEVEEQAEIRMLKSILTEDDFRNNLVDDAPEKRNDELDSLEEDLLLSPPTQQSKNVIANRSSSSKSTTLSARLQAAITATKTTTTTKKPPTKSKSAALEAVEENSTTVATLADESTQEPKQEDNSSEIGNDNAGDGGGGGLVGIIGSLSGGEGGSDIGALIGALTGVISTLFGPGGLDIESLIGTATSLISGLLAGNKNFGTVLGNYVGTAFEGLSGGGGAELNGKFIGNFLGTVVASLSADPEEEAGPQPLLFVRNVISSFIEAKNRKESSEETEERKGDASYSTHSHHKKGDSSGGGGSDSGGFIKHIVSHLVGSAVSLILNASLGAAGGASHASASLFGASSHKHPHGGGGGGGSHGKSW